ncbi:MAG: MATE family efflux transporter [Acidobacteriota bacterium]|nr:MATE family efflux transporter [Acidobacteriota bacterium]NLT33629.1 MATE family efflux transporter [Acidobacteriota bacterium]
MKEVKDIRTRSDMLAREKIGKLLWKLSYPAIIGMVVQGMYNIVDTFFVGRYTGTLGIGGTAVAFPIQMIVMGIGMTIGIGGASILSRRMGERNHEGASTALGNMILLSLITGVVCAAAGLAGINPLLRLFGANDALMPYATDYITVILMGSPLFTFSTVASAAARAEGNAKVAMNSLLLGGILNVILDPIFIIALDMGVRGAAIATVIAIAASCVFLLAYLQSGRSEIRLGWGHMRLKAPIVREIIAVGASDFARTAAMSLTSAIFNNILRTLGGELPIAVFGITFRIISFVFMPIAGIAQGVQPILGFNFGARQFDRIREGLSLASRSATALALVGFTVFLAFPAPILGIFSTDPKLLEMGSSAMRWLVLGLPLVAPQNIGTSLFQAIGKARPAIFLAFSRQVLFLIPVVIVLSRLLGLQGVWLSFPVSDVIAFVVTYAMVRRELRLLARMKESGPPERRVGVRPERGITPPAS